MALVYSDTADLVTIVAIFVDDTIRKQENQLQLIELERALTGFNEVWSRVLQDEFEVFNLKFVEF